MLESLIRFSIRQKFLIFLFTAVLVFCGIIAFRNLSIEAFPDVLNQTVQVITQVPGQSALDIERKITIPLEREFSGIPRVTQSRSISEFGLSVIYLYFEDGADGYWARSQVMEKISTATLPSGIQPSLAPMSSVTGEIFRYELKGVGYSPTQLRSIQDWILEKEFRAISGVADVTGYGGRVRRWEVEADPLKLSTFSLSIRQISDGIASANTNAGGNMIDWPNQSFVIRADGEYKSMDDLSQVGISQRGNAVIRIKDIGTVQETFAPIRGVVGRDSNDDIVQGILLLRKGENPIEVGRKIAEKIKGLNASHFLPEGVRIQTYYDRLKLVEKTTQTVGKNLLEGLLLICLVLYLFLRNPFATGVVTIIVPLSLLSAFILMKLTSTPANLISLGAIDFGIVVDGAVIIVEYVLREWSEHPGFILEKSVSEVIKPVSVSMSLIILAYLPIFTLQQVEGKMFTPLAWTICFTLLGALIFALTLIPALLPKVLVLSQNLSHEEPEWVQILRKHYERCLDWAFDHKKRVLQSAVAGAILGILIFRFMGMEFLPELDEGALWIRASFPHSTSVKEGVNLAHRIRDMIGNLEEVKTVVSQLGGPEDGTDPNLFDNCEFFVDLKPKEQWNRFHQNREELADHLRRSLAVLPGVDFNVSQPIADNVEEAIAGVKGKNAIKIYGADLGVLGDLANSLSKRVREIRGTADVGVIAATPQVPYLTVRVDRIKAAQAGLSVSDVNDLIEIAVGGKIATQIYEGEARLDVVVRAPERYRDSLEAIQGLPVPLQSGGKIRLDQIATVKMEDAPQAVFRENGYRRIGVKFSVEGRDLGSTVKDIIEKTRDFKLPAGYFMEWGGEFENQKRAMGRLQIVMPITLAVLGLVLYLLFEDIWIVGCVLVTLVLGSVGSFLSLWVRGIPFSVSAAVGLLALFGVIALNNITVASSYKRIVLAEGQLLRGNECIRKAVSQQFRSLLMTSVLAALGLLPAAISHGIGSETQRPLATAVIGGVLSAIPAILIFLPIALSLENDAIAWFKKWMGYLEKSET